ncbi:MAG: NAD-dependent epimerase/dehydratase, partial [Parcubacteria group bacterium GW2011_GWA2_44_13]
MAKKILITGGAGFVGSNLAEHLAQKGHNVVIYDNLSRNGSELTLKKLIAKQPKIEVHRGEMDDIADYLHHNGVDLVYHFAAQVAVTHSYTAPRSDFRINAHGTF